MTGTGAAIAPLVAACGPSGPAATSPSAAPATATAKATLTPATVKVQIGVQNVEFAGSIAADQQGLMKAVAITQELLAFGPNVQPVTVDAVGKRIGLQTGARGPWATIQSLAGLKESDMTIVPVQFDPTPLVQGQVDGFWAFAFNQPLVLQAQGLDTVFMTAFDAGYRFYGDAIITTDTAVKASANELARWLGATQKGWDYTFGHVDEVAKLVVDKSPALNLDLKQQTAQLKAEAEFMKSPKGFFSMEAATWQAGIDILKSLNQLDKPITAAEVMNTSILEMAAKGP